MGSPQCAGVTLRTSLASQLGRSRWIASRVAEPFYPSSENSSCGQSHCDRLE